MEVNHENQPRPVILFSREPWGYFTIFGGRFSSDSNMNEPYEMLRGYEREFHVQEIFSEIVHTTGEEFVNGTHQVAKGEKMDLAMIDDMEGVSIETFNLRGIPMNYAIINDRLVIFRDQPELWYYTQNTEYGLTKEIFGQVGKSTANAFGEYFVGKVGGKVPGAASVNRGLDKMPNIPGIGTNSGDFLKEEASGAIQDQIPFWKEIVSAEVPKSGTKQVLIYIGGDGETWDRRAIITLSPDGIVSIDDWYVGGLSETVKKDKAETTFSDLWNWATETVDENTNTVITETQKKNVEKYGLKDSKELIKGGGYNLNNLQNSKGLNIHTTTIENYPINYTVAGGNIIIPDNPNLYYSQTTVDHNAISQNLGEYAQTFAESAGNKLIGGAAKRVPGAAKVDEWIENSHEIPLTGMKVGELITDTSSTMIQSNIPGWEKIVNAPIPSEGEKQVLLQLSQDGEKITGTKLFYLKEDGSIELR